MKKKSCWTATTAALAIGALALSGAASAQTNAQDPNQTQPAAESQSSSAGQTATAASQRDAQAVISSWPDNTRTAARSLISQYGQPDTVLDKKLVWHDKGQWAMVAVYRDAFKRTVPAIQSSFVENAVNFRVPESKIVELIRFDPGLVVDYTHGTLAANGDSEKANTLALNLAHDIVTGKRSVTSARTFFRDTLMSSVAGKSSPYMDKLRFTPASSSGIESGQGVEGTQGTQGTQPETSPSGTQGTSPSGTQQQAPSGGY